MTDWRLSRRATLKAAGVGVLGAAGLSTVGGQGAGEVTVTVDPDDVTIGAGEETTLDVVVLGAEAGIEGYEFEMQVDPEVATFVEFDEERGDFSDSEIEDDGATMRFVTALGDEVYEGADEIVIASVTLEATAPGGSAIDFLSEGDAIAGEGGEPYETSFEPGSLTIAPDTGVTAAFTASPDEPQPGEEVSFDASSSAGEITEYRWTFGDGTETTTDEPVVTHVYDGLGEFTVTLEVEGEGGETDETTETVTVTDPGPDPEATFTVTPAEPETGEEVNFDADDSVGDIVEYRWDVTGDGAVDTTTGQPVVTHVYEEAGEVTVSLEIQTADGRTDETTREVTVETPPELDATFSVSPVDPQTGGEVSFDASDSTGEITEYRWTFGDGTETTTDGPTVTHVYDDPGEFTVTLEIEGGDGQTDSATESVTVDDQPPAADAAFTLTPDEPQPGEEVSFDAADSTGEVIEYRWAFGDGTETTTDGPTVTHVYDDPGEFTVSLEIETADGGTDETTETVTVTDPGPDPVAAFTVSPAEPETGEEVSFDAGESVGEIVEYRWAFGDGFEVTTDGPTFGHVYGEAGEFTVSLEIEVADGRTDETAETVTVTDPGPDPVAAFTASPAEPETGEEVSFDAGDSTGEITEYRWTFGDGTEDTTDGPTVTHAYDNADGFTVELTVTDETGREDATTRTVDVVEGEDGDDNGDDGFGPGFGPASVLAGLGGVGYLLRRRLLGDDTE